MLNAQAYVSLEWEAEARHAKHGKDPDGQRVDTPDAAAKGITKIPPERMWWKPGKNTGMPYKWGGFDTPQSFLERLEEPEVYAGDYATAAKVAGGNDAVSRYAAGIDCSGLVSRVWRLDRPYSTRELGALCKPIEWEKLHSGDILLLPGVHVMIFKRWNPGREGSELLALEAAGEPRWACNETCYRVRFLKGLGYRPYCYRKMR